MSSVAAVGLLENRYLSALFAIPPSLRIPINAYCFPPDVLANYVTMDKGLFNIAKSESNSPPDAQVQRSEEQKLLKIGKAIMTHEFKAT